MRLPEAPVWRPPAGARPPQPIGTWLRASSSLTHRLQRACGPEFAVRVLSQSWGHPLPDEARRLGLAPGRRAFVRRVQLLCGGVPWVFGRTVIPPHALHGRHRRLLRLGARPLGAVLFADPDLRRERAELARLLPAHALYADAGCPAGDALWARRRRYRLQGHTLLVTEVFLPALTRPAPPEPPLRRLDHRSGPRRG